MVLCFKNMKKKIIISLVVITFLGLFLLSFNNSDNAMMTVDEDINNEDDELKTEVIKDKKIEVVHFHGTRQCWSCIKVGELALKTIEEEFPGEYESGEITFLDVNGELVENVDIVEKYQARGSSIFVNKIINGEDNIEEDIAVWRLIYNEKEFIEYFKNKLSNI